MVNEIGSLLVDRTGNPDQGLPVQFHPIAVSINEPTTDRA